MTSFDGDFWPIARGMRGRLPNDRKPALKAWDSAVREGADPREIVAGLKGYLGAMLDNDTEMKHICMAATFINKGRWEQYLDEPEAKAYLAAPSLTVVK